MNAIRSSIPNSVFVLAHRAIDDRDDHLVVQPRRAADHIQVAVGDRVIGARADGYRLVNAHHCPLCRWIVIVVSP